ncbi:hypothetical protein CVT25_004071 [Psilocybe cyanescens]|uniref:DUF6534 domain-containing protein n=1 Tax=Psilocybe cyanescens TaxID=93625 RepID=A0A409XPS4_PSICY|nr:hypothetical protein CVT25_004071 [Psilocybe cyanescens]
MDNSVETPNNLRIPFLGFMASAILFGVTVLQSYQYFVNYVDDSFTRKATITIVCTHIGLWEINSFLDCLHFIFSGIMICAGYTSELRFSDPNAVWSVSFQYPASIAQLINLFQNAQGVKGHGYGRHFTIGLRPEVCEVTIFLPSIVNDRVHPLQFLFTSTLDPYVLRLLYNCSRECALMFCKVAANILSKAGLARTIKKMVVIAIGSTALIDAGIALCIAIVLYDMNTSETKRGGEIIRGLILFFVGIGILTSVCAVIKVSLFALDPNSVQYLAVQFWVPKIYANSILALFNAKSQLKEKLEVSEHLRASSSLFFGESPPAPAPSGVS